MVVELPCDVTHPDAGRDLFERSEVRSHHALAEWAGMKGRVSLLDLVTPLPPRANNIEEIGICRKTGGEAHHIVRIPRRLYLSHQARDLRFVHRSTPRLDDCRLTHNQILAS